MGVDIKTGWSVDPFGHGPTVPYLLKKSEITGGTVIQRIHYSWKEWFARTQNGDFFWRQNWDRTGHTDTLTHNMPFDIYSIRSSCGPHPQVKKLIKTFLNYIRSRTGEVNFKVGMYYTMKWWYTSKWGIRYYFIFCRKCFS